MTPEEKAKSLVDKFYKVINGDIGMLYKKEALEKARQCALIAVNEIIATNKWFYAQNYSRTIDMDITKKYSELITYWQKVKEQIQNHHP